MHAPLATAAHLAAARERLGLTPLEIAALLRIPTQRWREYESGRRTPPAAIRSRVRLLEYERRRVRLLEESGLPACEWMARLDEREEEAMRLGERLDAEVARDLKALERHVATCQSCIAIRRHLDRHLGPPPPFPDDSGLPTIPWLETLPPRLQAPAMGAFGTLSFSALFAIPIAVKERDAGLGLAILGGAALVGAGGGLAYDVVGRRVLRWGRLGRTIAGFVTCFGTFATFAAVVLLVGDGVEAAELRQSLLFCLAGALVVGPVAGRWMPLPEDVAD